MLRMSPYMETRLHVFQPLHEAVLVSMRSELWILRGERIELVHVDEAVVGENGLHPDPADVVQTRRHQHIGNRPLRHVLARLTPRDVSDGARMRHVDESIVQLHWIADEAAHRLIVLQRSRWKEH